MTLEASFAMAGLGMEPMQLDRISVPGARRAPARRRDGGRRVALRADGRPLVPDRPFPLRWIWRWRSVAGQVVELDRLVAVARADTWADDPAPPAADALARSRALGWRAVLAAHEAAWEQRWDGGRRPHRG